VTPEFDISYYPERAQHWIREHQDILDIVAGEFRNSGTWPAVSKLTRELARAGQPVPLAEVLFQMPRALGYVSHNPDQVVLFLPALQLTLPGQKLIDGYATTRSSRSSCAQATVRVGSAQDRASRRWTDRLLVCDGGTGRAAAA